MPTKTTKSPYDVHPGVKMIHDGIAKLKAQNEALMKRLEALEKSKARPSASLIYLRLRMARGLT